MKKYLIIIFVALLLIKFFGLLTITNTALLLIVLGLTIIGYLQNVNSLFRIPIFVMFVGLAFSMMSCRIYRGQDYYSSFMALPNYLYLLLYFGLAFIKPPLKQIEKALLLLIVIFNFLYILQFVLLQKGIIIFASAESSMEEGESARFRMMASGLTSLGLFFGLNKYFVFKEIKFLLIAISSVVVLLLMGFRTMIFFSALFSFYLLIKIYGFNWRTLGYVLGVSMFCLMLLQIPVFKDKVQYMVEKNQTQSLSNDDYIRMVTLKYYLHHYFKSNWEMFFGSGNPFPGTNYYKAVMRIQERGMWTVDWGLWGLSWSIGVISVIGMIWYSVKAFVLKVTRQYYYLGIWFLYLVISSITTAEFFRLGNFVIQAICLYTLEAAYHQNKSLNVLKKWYLQFQ